MTRPFFSVLITAYNREREAPRAVRSCSNQTLADFEIVVVDDASTDRTWETLAAIDEPRLRLVQHERNRGISPTRATAVDNATGEWLVILDSDWELTPGALARLKDVIDRLAPDVRIIRSRLGSPEGIVQPGIMPSSSGVTGYEDRLRWCEAVTVAGVSSDAGHCMHRSVLDQANYFADRRGAMEALWELELSQRAPSLWINDVLGLQHIDAANSHTRDVDPRRLVPRLLSEARDTYWMADRLLTEHDALLIELAPNYRLSFQRTAATNGFLAGDRHAGFRYTVRALRGGGALNASLWTTAALGLVGPRTLAGAKVLGRRARAATAR